jgi:hypothetical protein
LPFFVVLSFSAREQRTTPSALCVTGDIRIQNVSGLPPYDRPTIPFSRVALKPDDPSGKKKEQKAALPELSQTQITKLKHLSLLSYAMQQRVISSISSSPCSRT